MPDKTWQDAIAEVLREAGEPLHYSEITKSIVDGGHRTSVGATPAATVASVISTSLKNDGERSPYHRVQRGVYTLRVGAPAQPTVEKSDEAVDDAADDAAEMGLINAFGMFWRRDAVDWRPREPHLYGLQLTGGDEVDFSRQVGVYLLHDGNRVVYVGRVTEERLGARLREHTRDRLNGRWDRFSWFGTRKATDDARLSDSPQRFTLDDLVSTMEALLIEGLEPPQNRRQGDNFNSVEFIQAVDSELARQAERRLLEKLGRRL